MLILPSGTALPYELQKAFIGDNGTGYKRFEGVNSRHPLGWDGSVVRRTDVLRPLPCANPAGNDYMNELNVQEAALRKGFEDILIKLLQSETNEALLNLLKETIEQMKKNALDAIRWKAPHSVSTTVRGRIIQAGKWIIGEPFTQEYSLDVLVRDLRVLFQTLALALRTGNIKEKQNQIILLYEQAARALLDIGSAYLRCLRELPEATEKEREAIERELRAAYGEFFVSADAAAEKPVGSLPSLADLNGKILSSNSSYQHALNAIYDQYRNTSQRDRVCG